MKIFRETLFKWSQGFVELLFFLPVILLLGIYFLPSASILWLWIASLALFYLAGIVVRLGLNIQNKAVQLMLVIAISGCAAFFIQGITIFSMFSWLLGIIIGYRGIRFVDMAWQRIFPMPLFWGGLGLYFFAYFFYKYLPELKPYLALITWAGVLSVLVYLLLGNRLHLSSVTSTNNKRSAVLASMSRSNQFYLVVVFLVIVVIAGFNEIKNAITGWIRDGVVFLLSLIPDHGNVAGNAHTGAPRLDFSKMHKDDHTSPFFLWLEHIFYYVVIAIVLIAVVIVAYFVVKKLIKLLRPLIKAIVRFLNKQETSSSQQAQGYVDEKSSLFSWKDLNYSSKLKDWLVNRMKREKRWEDLKTNRERIRFLYRHFLYEKIAAGYPFKNFYTPKETGSDLAKWGNETAGPADDLIALYQKARYGEREIGEKEVKSIDQYR